MRSIVAAVSAIILGIWKMFGARLLWHPERRPEPISVETEAPYERTDSALDKIGKAQLRGVIYVIDALRTIVCWAFSRVGAVVVFLPSSALIAVGGLMLVTALT